MTFLRFRVIFYPAPSKEQNRLLIEKIAWKCGFQVIFMEKVELGNKSDPISTKDLDCVLYVHVSDENTLCEESDFQYVILSEKWCQHTRSVEVGERPMLQFYHNRCFSSTSIPIQYGIRIENIHFGVYPKSGEFLSYAFLKLSEMASGDYFTANFAHDLKELEIVCSTRSKRKGLGAESKVLIIPYKHIRNVIVDVADCGTNQVNLFLDLEFPPLFYKREENYGNNLKSPKEKLSRTLPFGVSKNVINKSNVILLSFSKFLGYVELLSCLRRNCRNIPVQYIAVEVKCCAVPRLPDIHWPHFGCSYLMTALLNRSSTILEQDKNILERFEKVSTYCTENGDSLESALRSVLFIADSGRFVNYWDAIDLFYSYFVTENSEDDLKLAIPPKCRLIRRITLTPTKMFMWPADLMSENRILRNFDSDYIVRVSFRDDDLFSLNFRHYEKKVLNEVIKKCITNGLVIGSRVYKLLAWSSSQLREHGVTMYATDAHGRSASDIIRWTEMDPRTTMNIPKCLARIGQCFSQTENVCHVPLDENHIEFAEDINGGFNPITRESYCFSDGIGKISPKLVQEIEKATGEKNKSSAFQIRYAGCKGMLVIDPHLVDKDIVFRNSMLKYDCRGSEHTNLEIAKKSKPLALRLNRPLIAILNDLGVPNTVFLKLQEQMIRKLIDMLLDEQEAVNCLNFRSNFRKFQFTQLSKSGVALTVEPFFRTFLLSLHKHFIDDIKRKASIEIDPDYGRNMFGVLDETGKLKYGQVFIQYSRNISYNESTPEDTKILEGTVMVTKCPCVHPADVRKFTAVDIPELHHIVDCIVFPQKGPRPHSNEMAGSDLDGDEYAVIWMKELFFNGENTGAPNYHKPPEKNFINVETFLKDSNTQEVANFFMKYVENDAIGKIAYAHLAFADKHSVFHPICLKIAEKHSFAVDFAKTGYFKRLEDDENPDEFPDFMDKFWKKKYKSKKVLGKMFRISKDFESENDVSSLEYSDIQVDSSLCVDGWEDYEESAVSSRNAYNRVLKIILDTYGISHETEAFGGSFLKLHERFRERRDRADIAKIVNRWLVELIKITRRQFFEFASEGVQSGIKLDEYLKKASAWYMVTYRKKCPEFLSFPWTVSDVLANIRILKYEKISQSLTPRIPLIEKIDASITQISQCEFLQNLPVLTICWLDQMQFTCDRSIVERAISVLTKWAEEEHILSYGYSSSDTITYNTFISHILSTAMSYGYLSNPQGIECPEPSSAAFCICFFTYLRRLRFMSKMDIKRLFPATLQDIRVLVKRASTTLHNIALTGKFQVLSHNSYVSPYKKATDNIEMQPVSIDSSILGTSPIPKYVFDYASMVLVNYCKVDTVSMRENHLRRKIIVAAKGKAPALQRLKDILNKSENYLKKFFAFSQCLRFHY
ncbi:putative RNA-dependent RNA polymerase 1 [Araneus ventricosus]|uniref:RNA-dependent RNA polymerase n=1 Tax=Araneus ventricosus TaxID=182803 RepID=A0A4Y2EDC4_ARAVE|nr:putative RNA-dependent RNA polymerase 1 [Araneus ventricosus]